MAQLIRTGPSGPVEGVGFVRRGVIHTVPDDMAKALLATGEWAALGAVTAEPERVTEPAPSQPAARARARKTKK